MSILRNKFNTYFYVLLCVFAFYSCKNKVEKGLKNEAGFPIGTAIKIHTLMNDATLQKLQIENFNSVTATSDMKMKSIIPAENQYNWKTADTILYYAKTHNQRL